jgi:glucose-6-phosphate 1-dehydrogenase
MSDPRATAEPHHRLPPADPCALVIFGATGDLTNRLVVPALYNLARTGVLPKNFVLIGIARREQSTATWRDKLREALESFVGNASADTNHAGLDEAAWARLSANMTYVPGDLSQPALYDRLRTALDNATANHGTRGNAIFYLAIADRFFATVAEQLGKAGLVEQTDDRWRRIVVEKPFGHSLESARALNADLRRTLHEDQIFRIDHFLGKEAVQSIMAFRFANGLFEPIWNRDRIDHVQITVAETLGVERRGDFYETTGALRDMVPNHVLSLISMIAMEPPSGFDSASIRTKKAEIFAAMPPLNPVDAVRGQYRAGTVQGKAVKGYRHEPDVAADSTTETFAALRVEIDNWRWAGVPFYLRTGKHLSERVTEIAISFKQAPYAAFRDTPVDQLRPNWLVLRIAPDESISLQFEVKRRGAAMRLSSVSMDFRYDDWFPTQPNVGYETLIYDVMIGDSTLFMRADMVEQAWRVVQPVLDAWAAEPEEPAGYASGSDGPKAADQLLARDGGRVWRPIGAIPEDKR